MTAIDDHEFFVTERNGATAVPELRSHAPLLAGLGLIGFGLRRQ